MKNKLVIVLCLVMAVSTLVGCGVKEKADKAITPPEQMTEKASESNKVETSEVPENPETLETPKAQTEIEDSGEMEPVTEVSNDIKDQAKKEGVSVKELEKTLDGLAQLGADKYGKTKAEYIADTKANGQTVLSEWQLTSENMGMSITELYRYEKARGDNLTEEQKATMQGMDAALQMAQAELADLEGKAPISAEELIGIDSNNGGEIVVVTLSDEVLREVLTVDTYKILQDYVDDFSINYEYITDAKYEDIAAHYIGLVDNTEEYMKLEPMGGVGVMLQGMINETMVYIEVDNSDPGKVRVSTYLDLSSKK